MKGLTQKWVLEVVSYVLIIFVLFASVLIMVLDRSYFNTVSASLEANCNNIVLFFGKAETENRELFIESGRTFIRDFSMKDKIEIWIIDENGNVVLSSGGFDVENPGDMPDYTAALNNGGEAEWNGRCEWGSKERIIARTVAVGDSGCAVRQLVSLEDINRQLVTVGFLVAGLSLLALAVIIFVSSRFLIKKIINPVKKVSNAAHEIANGTLTTRVESDVNKGDEIEVLCNSINDMASELYNADKMKNDFISTVSHELRTPLTAIKGWGETIIQIGDTDPGTTRRGMEVIVDETSRLNTMVEDLLDFSRVNNNTLRLNPERIDVLAELDECVFTFRDRAKKEGIELYYNVPQIPVPATGDANRIRQVFINLIDNAIKYNHQGGTVTITAKIELPSTLVITIADSGKGISAEDLPKVKEKFYKADYTVRGSGIGLAVVDEIVRLHNGEFILESVLGEGTAATIKLPVDEVQPVQSVEEFEFDEQQ